MCGIAGIVALDGHLPEPRLLLETLRHRGPDGHGTWANSSCWLGHRRLAVIDLTPAASQPLSNESGTLRLTFNGEIYNFAALRRELESHGHRFRSRTDGEVLLHAYEQWGLDALGRLRGMFAFGLWDDGRRRLVLARDRLGKKPLFYAQAGGCFLFASEIQAILAAGVVPREIDFSAIGDYLGLGYVPAPRTAFRHIRRVKPAHVMTVDAGRPARPPDEHCYWTLQFGPKRRTSMAAAADQVREAVTDAVRVRLASEVPLGALLSGGIDSAVVVGTMAKLGGARVRTFTIGFADRAFDERAAARRIAQAWGTEHHEIVIEPEMTEAIPTLVRHFGEPFADSSALPAYHIAKAARRFVTVALSGDGGDEAFGGYDRYRAHRLAARLAGVPGVARLGTLAAGFLPAAAEPRSAAFRARKFLSALRASPSGRYAAWVGGSNGALTPSAVRALVRPEALELLGGASEDRLAGHFAGTTGLDPLDAASEVDVRSYLPGDLLVKADTASMASSLEVRSPLLDHTLLELSASLPAALKARGWTSKLVLKQAFADIIPREHLRGPKRGFGVPVGRWLRTTLRPLVQDVLLSPRAESLGYLRRDWIHRCASDHLAGRSERGYELWLLLMLELWHQELVRQ